MPRLPGHVRLLRHIPLAIDPDEVLRFQGYKKAVDIPDAQVRALFEEALALGRQLMTPRATVRWVGVDGQGPDAVLVHGTRLTIPDIGRLWGPVEHVAAAVCTIGDALEGRVRELWDARELPLAMMLDSVGSGAVESLAEYVNDLFCQTGIALGLRVTNRISPGYARWAIEEQAALWQLCPGEPAGVTLSDVCVMTPGKSITLLAGAGRESRVDHYFSQCARCWMRDCVYRRAPAARTVHR